jgi:hypothetical protein
MSKKQKPVKDTFDLTPKLVCVFVVVGFSSFRYAFALSIFFRRSFPIVSFLRFASFRSAANRSMR